MKRYNRWKIFVDPKGQDTLWVECHKVINDRKDFEIISLWGILTINIYDGG